MFLAVLPRALAIGPLFIGSLLGGEICVKILDPVNLPLPLAEVSAVSLATGEIFTTVADREGKGCLNHVPEGLYSVEAGRGGFLRAKIYPVKVVPRGRSNIPILLPLGEVKEGDFFDREATISGTLREDQKPVSEAEICLSTSASAPKTCTTTDADGEYAVIVPPNIYSVSIRTRDNTSYSLKIDASVEGVIRNKLELPKRTSK